MQKPEWLTQMETALEVLNEGVIIANGRHQILFANSRFIEMTGIPLQELIGFDASRFYSSQEWDFLAQQIEVAFRAGRDRYAFVLPQKAGGRLPVIISSRSLASG
jgi:PAS domain S-box-containing protein